MYYINALRIGSLPRRTFTFRPPPLPSSPEGSQSSRINDSLRPPLLLRVFSRCFNIVCNLRRQLPEIITRYFGLVSNALSTTRRVQLTREYRNRKIREIRLSCARYILFSSSPEGKSTTVFCKRLWSALFDFQRRGLLHKLPVHLNSPPRMVTILLHVVLLSDTPHPLAGDLPPAGSHYHPFTSPAVHPASRPTWVGPASNFSYSQ